MNTAKTEDIKMEHLGFSYNDIQVLKNITFNVNRGEVFVYLDVMEREKTTIIKLLLGVLFSSSGNIRLFGEEVNKDNRTRLIQRVGSLIETASVYSHLSAYENLQIASKYYPAPFSVDELLRHVNLFDKKHEKVSSFSLGMRQRLGIALAMIGNSDIVILDEPTNGLDPQGIVEIRNLIIDLNKNLGKTFFVSSHLLSEVEKISTNLCIIEKGEMLYSGKIQDILSNERQLSIRYSASDNIIIKDLLKDYQLISSTENTLLLDINEVSVPVLLRSLCKQGVDIYEVNTRKKNLEDIFFGMIQNFTNQQKNA